MLTTYPTTAEKDAELLIQLDRFEDVAVASILSGGHTPGLSHGQDDEKVPLALKDDDCQVQVSRAEQFRLACWFGREHAALAVRYRMSRKQLLERVMHDLQSQAVFLDAWCH